MGDLPLLRAVVLSAALIGPAGSGSAGSLTSVSPFPEAERPDPPGVSAAPVPRLHDRPRAGEVLPARERIRRQNFERRLRAGGADFGDVLEERRRRR